MSAWWPPGHVLGWEHTFTHQVRDLVTAIGQGTDPEPSFADGLQVQHVLQAVAASAAPTASGPRSDRLEFWRQKSPQNPRLFTVNGPRAGSEGLLRLAGPGAPRVMATRWTAARSATDTSAAQRAPGQIRAGRSVAATYSDTFGGETTVVRIHSGNCPREEMGRRRSRFERAMQDAGLEAAGPLRQVLHGYFVWAPR